MRQKGQQKYMKIVRTPTREEAPSGLLVKGVDFSKDPEKVDIQCLSSDDGFIVFSGLLRKDWNIIDSANITGDNITITAKASVDVCSA